MFGGRAVLLTALFVLFAASAFAQSGTERKQPVGVYLTSAKIAMKDKPPNYKRAMLNLETARQYYPENFMVHFLLGTIWAEKDDIDSMVAEYALAEQYATEKEWKKKAKDLGKVYEQKWLDRFNRAAQLFGQADSMSETVDALEDAQKADSLRGVIGQIRGLTKEALTHCITLLPNDFRGYSVRGLVYQREGKGDSSLSDFVNAESLLHRYEMKDSTTDWYDTTVFFTGQGEATDDFKAYRKAYKKLSDEKRTRYRNLMVSLGDAYFDAEDWAACIVINRRYHGLFPKEIRAIVTLANVFAKAGDDTESFKWQEAVVRMNPNSKNTWYNLGSSYYDKGKSLLDSVAGYERLLGENADDPAAQEGFKHYSQSAAENFIFANARFSRVIEIDESDNDAIRFKGVSTFYSAVLLTGLTARMSAENAEETVAAIWEKAEGELSLKRGDLVFWGETKEALAVARERFPDDAFLCGIMKQSLARLRDSEGLVKLNEECP